MVPDQYYGPPEESHKHTTSGNTNVVGKVTPGVVYQPPRGAHARVPAAVSIGNTFVLTL
jgi:hypothetical protein